MALTMSEEVATEYQDLWVAEIVMQGTDVLKRHPRLMRTVLDLFDFSTFYRFESELSVFRSTRKVAIL